MMTTSLPETVVIQQQASASKKMTTWRRFIGRPAFKAGAVIGAVVILVAVVGPLVLGSDPYSVHTSIRLSAPSRDYFYGTDEYGRDLFSRVNVGFRVSAMIGVAVAVASALVGTVLGALAGFYRGLDPVIMRICDGLMAFPGILLAMALVASLGPSLTNVIIALTIVLSPGVARLIRSRVLAVKEELFVEAMRSQGATAARILIRHILPNTVNVLLVQMAYIFADSIMVEAALSFLGAGVAPPTPSLGNILYDGKQVFLTSPWMVIFPAVTLIATVMTVNLIGDAVREALDPKASRTKWNRRTRQQWLGRVEHA
ncbi:ABC transporter permease [Microbacterium sp. YY-01]|uniref:ABC transporter permease n=1 Tax=Microbacterium sp. YY-01 TaxID=3421634 RepID=UPI003D16FE54